MAENMVGSGMGSIIVQVYTADQAVPIADANVIITRPTEGVEELIRILKTDRSGKTEAINVPAPPAENSLTPDGGVRYYKYNIRVDYPGYYTMENVNVPIFEGQRAIQPIFMMPLMEDEERGKVVTVVEEEPFESE